MLLTVFLAIVVCAAVTMTMISAVAFIQDKKFFSSAPKEAQEAIQPREKELFYGARVIGWAILILSFVLIAGVVIIAIWDGFRNDFTFLQFFMRLLLIFTIYNYSKERCMMPRREGAGRSKLEDPKANKESMKLSDEEI